MAKKPQVTVVACRDSPNPTSVIFIRCVQPDLLKSEHLPWSSIPKALEARSDPLAGNRG